MVLKETPIQLACPALPVHKVDFLWMRVTRECGISKRSLVGVSALEAELLVLRHQLNVLRPSPRAVWPCPASTAGFCRHVRAGSQHSRRGEDRQTGNRARPASFWLSALLALEIATTGRARGGHRLSVTWAFERAESNLDLHQLFIAVCGQINICARRHR
jgi:hypothetical protein